MKGVSALDPKLDHNQLFNLIRIQKHDFLNHLQVISGMLQLNRPDKALNYVREVSELLDQQGTILRLPLPIMVSKLLLKMQEARNYQLDLVLRAGTEHAPALVQDEDLAHMAERVLNSVMAMFTATSNRSGKVMLEITNDSVGRHLWNLTFPLDWVDSIEEVQAWLEPVGLLAATLRFEQNCQRMENQWRVRWVLIGER